MNNEQLHKELRQAKARHTPYTDEELRDLEWISAVMQMLSGFKSSTDQALGSIGTTPQDHNTKIGELFGSFLMDLGESADHLVAECKKIAFKIEADGKARMEVK